MDEPSGSKIRKSGKPFQFVPSACQICHGKATGHHYDVPSCNGCKSFFRRVTIEKLKYKCQAENLCFSDENLQNSEFQPKCRACRYQKCVEKGMNPLGIQSEAKKVGKMEVEVVLPRISEPPKSVESQISDLIDHLVHLDLKTRKFRDCSYNPTSFPYLKDAVKDEISILGLGDRMEPMPGWPLAPEIMEQVKKPNPHPGSPRILPPNVKRWLFYDLLTVIEMTKTFAFFRKLSESDRYFLCRDTVLMVANLTKAHFCFENQSSEIVRPDGQKSLSKPKWLPEQIHLKLTKDVGKRVISTLMRIKIDNIEFLLLRAVLLCNSAAPEISQTAREILEAERKKYTMALLNYVMRSGKIEGPARFSLILNVIDVLEHQQKDQRDLNVFCAFYRPKWVKLPLMDEIMMT